MSVGSFLRARSPDPVQLSQLREPGTRNPAGPQIPQAAQRGGGGVQRGGENQIPQMRPGLTKSREQGRGRFAPASGPWVSLVWALGSCWTQRPVYFLGPSAHPWPKAEPAGGPLREGGELPLSSVSTSGPPLRQLLAGCPTDARELTGGFSWMRPAAALTSGWAGPPAVTHPLLLVGGAHSSTNQWPSRACCLSTGCLVTTHSGGWS